MPQSEDCICGPFVTCLWHYGEAKIQLRKERAQRGRRAGRKPARRA